MSMSPCTAGGTLKSESRSLGILGRANPSETQKLAASSIKQEEPSKYRCKPCAKLFKAPEFVVKHIASKHPEILKPKLDLVSFVLRDQNCPKGRRLLLTTTSSTHNAFNPARPFSHR